MFVLKNLIDFRVLFFGLVLLTNAVSFSDEIATIKKAQSLFLEKKRLLAIEILLSAGKDSKPSKKIISTINEISEAFLSEEALQLFESSLSLQATEPLQSQAKIIEALKIEPDNFLLLNEKFKYQILAQECAKAWAEIAEVLKKNPHFLRSQISDRLVQICLKKPLSEKALADKKDTFFYWSHLEGISLVAQKSMAKAKDKLYFSAKLEPFFPENYYWLWMIEKSQHNPEDKSRQWAEKYIASCKGLTSQLKRSFGFDPFLCKKTAELESDLGKTSKTQ